MQFVLSFHLNTKTDSKKLTKFLTFWAKKTSTPIKLLPLDRKTKLLTLVKSPHVFKKSKEQFFISLFVVRIKLFVANLKPFYKMLTYLVNTVDLLCVKIEVQSDF
jgi:ribosomal protein S10